jgi:hypothetical protein
VARQNSSSRATDRRNRLIGEVIESEAKDLRGKSRLVERRISFSKPPYAALWKSSIWRIQLVSGFHLGKIWATNLSNNVPPRRADLFL